jgi:DNA-directed RNA polymerase specialized sigma24 family protein
MTDTDPMRERMAAHLRAAVACLEEIPDPVEREHAARALVDELLPETLQQAKAVRRAVVVELRQGRGLTLKQTGELLGLSVPRVDQLAKGK